MRLSYLHHGESYTGKMAYLYWISPQLLNIISLTQWSMSHWWHTCWGNCTGTLSFYLSHFNSFNTLGPRQNRRHFADDIFKCIFLNENVWISIKISLNFIPKGPINNIPTLVQIMAWRRPDDKPLSEAMTVNLPTHICVTRPQWVNYGRKQIPYTSVQSSSEFQWLKRMIGYQLCCSSDSHQSNISHCQEIFMSADVDCRCCRLFIFHAIFSVEIWNG